MAAIATLPVLLAVGIHSARPAASAVGSGGLYSCTTHNLIYQTDGSAWTTWATVGSGFSDPMTSRGDMIIRNASNVTDRLGVGSNGDVLSSDGTDISWQPGGGGALVLLEQHDAAGTVATLDFTSFISSTYDDYLFEGVNVVPATNATSLFLQVGSGGGPTYDSGNNYYSSVNGIAANTNAIGFQTNPGAGFAIAGAIANAAQYGHASFSLHLLAPQNSDYKTIHGTSSWHNGTSVGSGNLGGLYVVGTALTAVRFTMASGSITSGIIRVYGIAK